MSFVNIETKEDSAEKLAQAAGKPTKNFLFAPEFNLLKNKVNEFYTLWTNSQVTLANQTENEAAATATDLATINNTKATTPRGLRWFWNSLRAIAWSWSGKQSFFGGVNMGSLTASRWLRLNGDKDIESFDGQALLDGKVDKADLVITSGTNITTDANWSGRLLKINNGSSDISITVNHAITFAGVKEGSGNIQFVSGSVTVTPVDGLSLLSGNIGSTFGVSKRESTSNAINLFITNR